MDSNRMQQNTMQRSETTLQKHVRHHVTHVFPPPTLVRRSVGYKIKTKSAILNYK